MAREIEMGRYHKPESCNYCGGKNALTVTDGLDGHMHECKTVCEECGKADYWAHGFFESSQEIEGKCETYGSL
jgi:hypothetical protein